jgi:hypothetical protein
MMEMNQSWKAIRAKKGIRKIRKNGSKDRI